MPDASTTLADIARLAGVSVSTVSRALRDSDLVNADVKRRIKRIARQQNYQAHLGARNLRLKRSSVVAVVIPIEAEDALTLSSPFVLDFLAAVGLELRKHGYNLLLVRQRHIDEQLWRSGLVDGYIQLGLSVVPERLKALSPNLPLVVWGVSLPDRNYCTVCVDNRHLAKRATRHLISLGRKRIGLLVSDFGNSDTESYFRYLGYRDSLEEAGIPFDAALLEYAEFDVGSGKRAAETLLERVPDMDSLFSASGDVVALAAINLLSERGKRVPEDVAVVGFDNTSLGEHLGIPLTTTSQEIRTKGARVLVETLLKQIGGEDAQSVTVEGQLIIRQSCGAAHAPPSLADKAEKNLEA